MKPVEFAGMNKVYTKPKDWDEATMGICRDLPVREENGQITSCYELDGAELAKLAHGAKLYFTIFAPRQPVVGWEIK